jgi:hypothetical protein
VFPSECPISSSYYFSLFSILLYCIALYRTFKQRRAEDMCQVVEYLPGRYKALSSNSSTVKKKERNGIKLTREVGKVTFMTLVTMEAWEN